MKLMVLWGTPDFTKWLLTESNQEKKNNKIKNAHFNKPSYLIDKVSFMPISHSSMLA